MGGRQTFELSDGFSENTPVWEDFLLSVDLSFLLLGVCMLPSLA